MKQLIKKLVKNESLQDKLRLYYNTLKTISPKLLIDEINFRINGLPDKFPYPNSKHIFTIIAIPWVSEYYKSGEIVYNEITTLLEKANISLNNGNRILDFGCGCARLIRHFAASNKFELYGSDLNPDLIKWCKANLEFGDFQVNNVNPPINYSNDFFDLIYARSVFTHLGEKNQKDWMDEFRRILKPGGFFYFTTHGKVTLKNLSAQEKKLFFQNKLVVHCSYKEGDNKYSTYQSYDWTTNNLLSGFRLLHFEEGKPYGHLRQDVYIFQKV